MKKKRKKNKRKNKIKKKSLTKKKTNRPFKIKKKSKIRSKKKKIKKIIPKKFKKIKNKLNFNKAKKDSLALRLVKLQLSLKPGFNFRINFSLEKYIQGFFDKISETISNYKVLKQDEKENVDLKKLKMKEKLNWLLKNKKKKMRL